MLIHRLLRPLFSSSFSSLIALWLCVIFLQLGCTAQAVILVRHGEKLDESEDAQLSPAGEARAARLAELLNAQRVASIFVSERVRTQQTAQPLAQRLGVTPTVIPAKDRATLTARLRAVPKGDVALVVGHSNTLPMIFADLGVPPATRPATIEYGDVFVLIHRAIGDSLLLRLHY